jgi:hypothetical protein
MFVGRLLLLLLLLLTAVSNPFIGQRSLPEEEHKANFRCYHPSFIVYHKDGRVK